MARLALALGSLALSLLAPAAACGPLIVDIESDSEAESAGETENDASTTVETTTTTTATTTTATTTTATSTTTTTTADPTGDEPGYCSPVCGVVADCVALGGVPEDWACTDGFCEYIGLIPACDPATCDDLMIGVCAEIDGLSTCTTPCTNDTQCLAGFTECTGVDDAGNSICEAIPCFGTPEGEACFIEGFGQYGVCIDGLCSCTDDTQCTPDGYACNV
jgi:hypothetical protein